MRSFWPVLFLFLIFAGCSHPDYSDNSVGLYSQTGCGFCAEKHEELEDKGVPFQEFFIDTNSVARRELLNKMREAGLETKTIATPVVIINDSVLPGNPSWEEMEVLLKVKPEN